MSVKQTKRRLFGDCTMEAAYHLGATTDCYALACGKPWIFKSSEFCLDSSINYHCFLEGGFSQQGDQPNFQMTQVTHQVV